MTILWISIERFSSVLAVIQVTLCIACTLLFRHVQNTGRAQTHLEAAATLFPARYRLSYPDPCGYMDY